MVPVHNRYKVHISPFRGNLDDIGCPDLIHSVYLQFLEQAEIHFVPGMGPVRPEIGRHGFNGRQSHQPLNSLSVYF